MRLSINSALWATKDDLVRLLPLSHKHFNMLGCYHFAVLEKVLRGSCRPAGLVRSSLLRKLLPAVLTFRESDPVSDCQRGLLSFEQTELACLV